MLGENISFSVYKENERKTAIVLYLTIRTVLNASSQKITKKGGTISALVKSKKDRKSSCSWKIMNFSEILLWCLFAKMYSTKGRIFWKWVIWIESTDVLKHISQSVGKHKQTLFYGHQIHYEGLILQNIQHICKGNITQCH